MNRRHHVQLHFSRSGFTLLELLIASLLLVTLMSGVWSLTGLYTGLLTSGRSQVEEQRLARSLSGLLAEDLQSVVVAGESAVPHGTDIPDYSTDATQQPVQLLNHNEQQPLGLLSESLSAQNNVDLELGVSAENAAPAARAPECALHGTQQSLRLTIYQPLAQQNPVWPGTAETQTQDDAQASQSAATGLRHIRYTFQAPYVATPNDRRPPAGLLRTEDSWIDSGMDPITGSTTITTPETTQPIAAGSRPIRPIRPNNRPLAPDAQHDSTSQQLLVPEVVGCRFRYFDGRSWISSWNSVERQSLPRAVEIEFWLLTTAEIREHFGTDMMQPADSTLSDATDSDPETVDQTQPIPARQVRRILFLGPGLLHQVDDTARPLATVPDGVFPSEGSSRREFQ